MDLPVVIRDPWPTDKNFISDSWSNAACYNLASTFWVPHKLTKKRYQALCELLLDRKPELFRIAVNENDLDQIFGWACVDKDCLHFVYIKQPYRGFGLTKMLIGERTIVSHWSKGCEDLNLIYKPSLFKDLIYDAENQTTKCGATELHPDMAHSTQEPNPAAVTGT